MDERRQLMGGRPTLSDELDAAREAAFVGRAADLAAFASSLSGAEPTRVHFLHGPGGIGKSTLLDAMARMALRDHRHVVRLDGTVVVRAAGDAQRLVTESMDRGGPSTLLVDNVDRVPPLEDWLRDDFLPGRPADMVTVLAARSSPSPTWRIDPGWRRHVLVHSLERFGDDDSRSLLAGLGVPEHSVAELARLGRGHPLVLALLAEAHRGSPPPATLGGATDVVKRLCQLIVDDIPDTVHRMGLATCAQVSGLTMELLSRTVGDDADRVWRWLELRPYVDAAPSASCSTKSFVSRAFVGGARAGRDVRVPSRLGRHGIRHAGVSAHRRRGGCA